MQCTILSSIRKKISISIEYALYWVSVIMKYKSHWSTLSWKIYHNGCTSLWRKLYWIYIIAENTPPDLYHHWIYTMLNFYHNRKCNTLDAHHHQRYGTLNIYHHANHKTLDIVYMYMQFTPLNSGCILSWKIQHAEGISSQSEHYSGEIFL
jgi:hypothetical protein